MAALGHLPDTDPIHGSVPDGTGVRRATAVRGIGAERDAELHGAVKQLVRVPVRDRRCVRGRTVPGLDGRPANQLDRYIRVSCHGDGVQRLAVRVPVADPHQGQVQGVNAAVGTN